MCYIFLFRELSAAAGGFGGREDGAGTRLRGSCPQPGTRVGGGREFFTWIRCNALKSPDSTKGIQGNASNFPWFSLDSFARNSRLSCIHASIGLNSSP